MQQARTSDPLTLAMIMTLEQAAEILTHTDEPDLIDEGPLFIFDTHEIAAARLRSSWDSPSPAESAAVVSAFAAHGLFQG